MIKYLKDNILQKFKKNRRPKDTILDISDLSEEELNELNTYYFTFGSKQCYEGKYQPIMAKNMEIASKKMFEMYGRDWSFNYTEEQWNKVLKDFPSLYEGKDLKLVIAL